MARQSITKKTPFWRRSLDLGGDIAMYTAIILLAPVIKPAVAASRCHDRYKAASRELYSAALWTRGDDVLLNGAKRVIEQNSAALTAEESERLDCLVKAAQSSISRIRAFVEERAPGEDYGKVKRSKKIKMALWDEKTLHRLSEKPRVLIDSIREYLN